jgi:hypothetical protein
MARPSTFSHARADEICKRLAAGESLRAICASPGMPSFRTFYDWMEAHPSLAQQYAHARDVGLDVMADECIALADVCREGVRTKRVERPGPLVPGPPLEDGSPGPLVPSVIVETETVTADMIERAKLQFQARQWYLSKLAPKRYGDQQVQAGPGAVQINLVVLPAGADAAAGSVDLRAMVRGGEVRALPAPGGDDDAS